MVPLSRPKSSFEDSNFGKRILSAAIAGPIALGAVILGSPYVDIISLALLGILLWEWSRMSRLPWSHPMNGVVIVLLGSVMFGPGTFLPAFCIVSAGILYTIFYHHQIGARFTPSLILLVGPLYVGVGMAAILSMAKFNPLLLLWALMIVWATDTGAFVVGSLLGGPKLAPSISPRKTWAGLIGGSLVGSALGFSIAPYCQLGIENPISLICLTIVVTLVGHTGDLLESAAKRLFKVKDSSHIIPGHGGLLDRIDSLLLVAFFLIILKFFKIF